MCFTIDCDAKKPTQKTVYKILHVNELGVLCSPELRFRNHSFYKLGETRVNESLEPTFSGGHAKAGIYVHSSLKRAVWHTDYYSNVIIVKCKVDPADHLFSSHLKEEGGPGRAMTYQKITPLRIVKVYGLKYMTTAAKAAVRKMPRVGSKKKGK